MNDSEVQAKIKLTDAIEVAKEYGSKLEAEKGRLMTYKEANTLLTENSIILYGNKDGKKLNYWLGSADNGGGVWFVGGGASTLYSDLFSNNSGLGVRPVIEVSTSSIN